MATSSLQVGKIVDRLVDRTMTGTLPWTKGLASEGISTRLGNYQVGLNKSRYSPNVTMIVSDISSGSSVKVGADSILTSTSSISYSMNNSGPGITNDHQQKLNKLYFDVTNEDETLDGLLKALN